MSKDNSQPEAKATATEAAPKKAEVQETPRKGFNEAFVGYDPKGTKRFDN